MLKLRLSLFLLTLTFTATTAAIVTSSATAQHAADKQMATENLGVVHFPTSCSPDVQGDFNQAVALLHHMMYIESRRAFEGIAEKDPACAMAHWGIAMTLFQPLWHPAAPEALKRGWEEVQKAKALGPATDRERALVAAVEAVFREPESADWWARLTRWSEAMGAAYRKNYDDYDIAALYALSELAAGQVAEDRMAHQARAANVLLRIYEREPTHPGAIHYTIHANDVDTRAGESLDIVRSYGQIAPSVPHALHMPTHIFVRLGAWPDVIEWNRKSAEAALRFPAGDAISLHYPHAMDYQLYAYLQRAEDEKARAVLDETLRREPYQADFASAFHLAAMPARYAVERRAWAEAAALSPRSPAYLNWDGYRWPEALTWFAKGLGAVHTRDLAGARKAEARMQELHDRAKSAGERDFARYIEIDRQILAAFITRAEGDAEGAVARLRQASEAERAVQKHPVTPGGFLPANEALGDLLLELKRPNEALAAYETALRTAPRRYNTVLGAARAARDAGDLARAGKYYADLLSLVGEEAAERSGIAEAREFAAGTRAE